MSGEKFLLLNMVMDMLSLLLAGALGRLRLPPGRWFLSALAGTIYSLAAVGAAPSLGEAPGIMLGALIMAMIAFGRMWLRGWLLIMASGLTLSGLAGFVMARGATALAVTGWGATLAFLTAAVFHARVMAQSGTVTIQFQGRCVRMTALVDTGNQLTLHGVPVVVIPFSLAELLLPDLPGPQICHLRPGMRVLRARTAGGECTMICFSPDSIVFCSAGRKVRLHALAAIAPEGEQVLLPASLFSQNAPKEVSRHAKG